MNKGLAVLAACALLAPASGISQQYPAKPIRIVTGFAPGGPTDIYARLLGQKFIAVWGQQVIVDARPGASGTIATDHLVKSQPDGYTLMVPSFSMAVNASLYAKLPYDIARDIAPVAMVASVGHVLVVHPSVPARSVAELVTLARRQPAALAFSSAGTGTAGHLCGELFNMMAGAKVLHVPYKGMAPAQVDTISGQVSYLFDSMSTALPVIKSGRLRPLGVTTLNRQRNLPEVPTIDEAGLKGFEVGAWCGLIAPAGTPRDIVQKLSTEVSRALRDTEVLARLNALGAEPVDKGPDAFGQHLRAETEKWAKVIKAAGIKLQ